MLPHSVMLMDRSTTESWPTAAVQYVTGMLRAQRRESTILSGRVARVWRKHTVHVRYSDLDTQRASSNTVSQTH